VVARSKEVHMQAFIFEAANKPGEFARYTEAVAQRGINLSAALCLGMGDRGAAAFISADEAGLRSALNDEGLACREVPIVTARLDDRPGTAAAAARRLADAGVNIELFAPVASDGQTVTVAIGVDNVEKARTAIGDMITEWSAIAAGSATR
jgi:hypothetical protein